MSKDTKVCLHCNIEKSLEEYPKYKGRDGNHAYRNVCKACFNAQTNKNRTTDYKPRPKIIREEIPEEYKIERNINKMFDESEITILKQIIKEYPEFKKTISNNKIELYKPNNKRVRKTITIDEDLDNIINNKMNQSNLNYSDIINVLIRKSIEYID